MHLNILDNNQQDLLPLLSKFKNEFYLVGDTAIALHIGHRISIDFDLFKTGIIKPKAIINRFEKHKEKISVTYNTTGQLNLICREVKFTFFDFEFAIPHPIAVQNQITIPTLLDLAAMKAYALGRRSKWKDYVDLYFIIKGHYNIKEISNSAMERFGDLFSEKLFRGQLSYFTGINFEEKVDFLPGFETDDNTIKDFLIDAALTGF
jgi:Nucleotidyl transferase AbiEii toxin, Type IV TA system